MAQHHYVPPEGLPPDMASSDHQNSRNISGLSTDELHFLVNEIKDYQLTHGSFMKLMQIQNPESPTKIDLASIVARPIGVSMLPTKFPRHCFEAAFELQQSFNELYIRVAADEEWILGVLEPLFETDELLATLWEVHLKVKELGEQQATICGIFRSDYMLNSTGDGVHLKQVEINNFSVAGACHAKCVADMHAHLRNVQDGKAHEAGNDLPSNENIGGLVSGLEAAHNAYVSSGVARTLCVLMPVQPINFNIADERPIERGLWDRDIPCYRCEWKLLLRQTRLTENRTLLFKPLLSNAELEVSVVYYRAGYDVYEYNDDAGYETRVRLELSRAVKCPDVLTHLTTFKAVQQALTQAGAVERFLSPGEAAKIRATFMPIYALSEGEGRDIARDPQKVKDYVLKPNLEGGGHNIYRSAISTLLSRLPEAEWQKYVLMRLIEPPEQTEGALVVPDDLYQGPVVSELGILGTCLWRKKDCGEVEIISNKDVGWTFKTKPRGVDEMSVVKGYGCFDCPSLQM